MKSNRIQCFECTEEGHEDNLMNSVCIDKNCKNRGLICIMCQYEQHQLHKNMPLKIFLMEYKQSMVNFKASKKLEEEKLALKQANNKPKNGKMQVPLNNEEKLEQKRENIKEMLLNFQAFINEQIEFSIKDITSSFDRKQKKIQENQFFEEDQLIQDIEKNQVASAEEAQTHLKKLVKKVKGTSSDDKTQLIIEVVGMKQRGDQDNIKQKLENFDKVEKSVSEDLSLIQQKLFQTLSNFKSEQVYTQQQQNGNLLSEQNSYDQKMNIEQDNNEEDSNNNNNNNNFGNNLQQQQQLQQEIKNKPNSKKKEIAQKQTKNQQQQKQQLDTKEQNNNYQKKTNQQFLQSMFQDSDESQQENENNNQIQNKQQQQKQQINQQQQDNNDDDDFDLFDDNNEDAGTTGNNNFFNRQNGEDSNKINESIDQKYNKNNNNNDQKNQLQQQKVNALQPYYKKQDIDIQQLQIETVRSKNINSNNNNKKKNTKEVKQPKLLTRNAQQKDQKLQQQQQQLQQKLDENYEIPYHKKKKEITTDTIENLFSTQGIDMLDNKYLNEKEDEEEDDEEQIMQNKKQTQQQQQHKGKFSSKNMMKDSLKKDEELIDQAALDSMIAYSQRNQDQFYNKVQGSLGNSNINNSADINNNNVNNTQDLGEISLDIKHKKPIEAFQNAITDIVFVDKEIVATCSFDKIIKIWNVNGTLIQKLNHHTQRINKLAHSKVLNLLVSVDNGNSIILWDDKKRGNFELKLQQNKCHTDGIYCVLFIEEEKQIITGGKDKLLKIWNIQERTLKLTQNLVNNVDICFTVIFSPVRRQVISGGEKYLTVWKKNYSNNNQRNSITSMQSVGGKLDQKPIQNIKAHKEFINKIIQQIINTNQVVLITGSDDCTVKVWNAFDYSLVTTIQEEMEVNGLCYIDMTGILVLGLWEQNGGEGKICFWDISQESSKIQEVSQVSSGTSNIITNEDNSYLVSSHENGKLEIFNLNYLLA